MQAVPSLAKSVQSANAAVTKTVSDLSERVEAVAVMAKKTDAALNGTVFNETAATDRPGLPWPRPTSRRLSSTRLTAAGPRANAE